MMEKKYENEELENETVDQVVDEVNENNEDVVEATLVDEPEQASPENDESTKLRDTIARLQADFQNYRNRTEKEKSAIYKTANESLILKLLPVMDNLERAIASEKEHDAFYEGVKLIHQDMMKVLENEGLTKIESDGELFDPNLHHAVFMEESDSVESEHIIETFQVGYKLKDKIIRPAMVKVAK
ncbi:MAG: nucleotide exchange factor GrpE [Tissierellia bacterium]|nr:nucleotide exchange factor GrpE [Tissierellia bacterium]